MQVVPGGWLLLVVWVSVYRARGRPYQPGGHTAGSGARPGPDEVGERGVQAKPHQDRHQAVRIRGVPVIEPRQRGRCKTALAGDLPPRQAPRLPLLVQGLVEGRHIEAVPAQP